ncbi:MAG: glycosyltransferase family 2 protein [Bacteroidia bacterium]
MLKLSIITINYNNAEGLEKTIQSVVAQTFINYEFIIIDGNSTDNSKQIIEKYHHKITSWVSEPDTGIYNAMNKGILKATGKYCLFLNSGDYLVNENIIDKIFNTSPIEDIIYGELIFDFKNNNQVLKKLPSILTLTYLFYDNIWHPASFIKRNLFNKCLYKENYEIAADYDFFFNAIIIKMVKTKYLPFPITVYETSGLSSKPDNFEKIKLERQTIHQSYLDRETIIYLKAIVRFYNKPFFKWLINKTLLIKTVKYFLKKNPQ